jgi:hypothetical protein
VRTQKIGFFSTEQRFGRHPTPAPPHRGEGKTLDGISD